MADSPQLVVHRQSRGSKAAIVFVHGFGGDAISTWGGFPTLLAAEAALAAWDIYSLGYSTSLSFDIAGVWSADPEIVTGGGLLTTQTSVPPLDGYDALAFLAHSMGGLLVQRGLLSEPALRRRVSHLMLFGTPSAGLQKASPFAFWKRQTRDMACDSPFITTLRQQWNADVTGRPPFRFVTVAGERDEFVPRLSSLDPFAEPYRRVVYGNHLDIVKPEKADHLGFKLAMKTLRGDLSVSAIDAARLAVESRAFQSAIDTLWPIRTELDDRGLVNLALALDAVDRRADAIALLRGGGHAGTDPLGVLAGRLKRRWLVEHRKADAEEALALYRQGFEESFGSDAAQAFYHAINCAFMARAYRCDVTASMGYAQQALAQCAASGKDDVWRHATEGEAHIYLGHPDEADAAYGRALQRQAWPWQVQSLYQQAVRAADLTEDPAMIARINQRFPPP